MLMDNKVLLLATLLSSSMRNDKQDYEAFLEGLIDFQTFTNRWSMETGISSPEHPSINLEKLKYNLKGNYHDK